MATVTRIDGSGLSRKLARIWCARGVSDVAKLRCLRCLGGRDPAPDHGEVVLGGCLVRRHHQQLAKATSCSTRFQVTLLPPAGAHVAEGDEGFAQQRLGKAGAERREQGRARGLVRMQVASRCGPISLSSSSRQRASPSKAPKVTGSTARRTLEQRLGAGVAVDRLPISLSAIPNLPFEMLVSSFVVTGVTGDRSHNPIPKIRDNARAILAGLPHRPEA